MNMTLSFDVSLVFLKHLSFFVGINIDEDGYPITEEDIEEDFSNIDDDAAFEDLEDDFLEGDFE